MWGNQFSLSGPLRDFLGLVKEDLQTKEVGTCQRSMDFPGEVPVLVCPPSAFAVVGKSGQE
jgi:hypothetical protein